MGFSSFLTADTKQSIYNRHSKHYEENKPVYLLMPGGGSNIKLFNYDGYHTFETTNGNVNIYEKLFYLNFGENIVTENCKFDLGVACYIGTFFKTKDGNIYANKVVAEILRLLDVDNVFVYENYINDIYINGERTTLLEYKKSGNFEVCKLNSLLNSHLKFSFFENAKYEDLERSENCLVQGFY